MAFSPNKDRELWGGGAEGQNPRRLREAHTGETFDLILWSPTTRRLLVTLHKRATEPDSAASADSSKQGTCEWIDSESGQVLHREEGVSTSSGFVLPDGSFY